MKVIVVKKRSDDFRDYGTDGKFSIYHLLGFQLLKVPESSSILSAREAAQKLEKTQNAFSGETNLIAQFGRPKDGGSAWDEFVPYFYGDADIEKCIHEVHRLTSDVAYNNHCKIVLFISNGKPFVITDLEKWEVFPMPNFFPTNGAVSTESLEIYLEREKSDLKMYLTNETKELKMFLARETEELKRYLARETERLKKYVTSQTANFKTLHSEMENLKLHIEKKTQKLKMFHSVKILFETNNFNVFSLYVSANPASSKQEVNGRTLFCDTNRKNWQPSTQMFFKLSSKVECFKILPNVFQMAGWTLEEPSNPQKRNEVKLFVHANNHSNVRSVCAFAKQIFTDKDCLSDILSEVSLVSCINQKQNKVIPGDQGNSDDCLEYAAAAAMYLELHRIPNRQGEYPTVEKLREELIEHFKSQNKIYTDHLDSFAKTYRLRAQKVEYQDALEAASNMHFVIAVFSWNNNEKQRFKKFFQNERKGILRRKNLPPSYDINHTDEKDDEHAVVLTSFTSKFLRFMNSWGIAWADSGFFKIENSETLRKMTFIKIHVDKNRLLTKERTYAALHGSKQAAIFLKNLQGLKLSQHMCPSCKRLSCVSEFKGVCPFCKRLSCVSEFKGVCPSCERLSCVSEFKGVCPSCERSSCVSEYKGVMFRGICPKCNNKFTLDTDSGGNLLLYQYLVSLSNS